MDVGTGDGRLVLDRARREPTHFCVGLDANAELLAEASRRAAGKPARGGVPNALFGRARVEELPATLDGLAGELTVVCPWGSLLGALVRPDAAALGGLRRIARPGATLAIVLGYHARLEPGEAARLGLPPLDETIADRLAAPYRAAGFERLRARALTLRALREVPSSWARRLSFGRDRPIVSLEARAL